MTWSRLAADELVHHLGDLLGRIGIFDREGEPHQDEECNQDEDDQHLQGEGVGDGRVGCAGWMPTNCISAARAAQRRLKACVMPKFLHRSEIFLFLRLRTGLTRRWRRRSFNR